MSKETKLRQFSLFDTNMADNYLKLYQGVMKYGLGPVSPVMVNTI